MAAIKKLKLSKEQIEAVAYYDARYDVLGQWLMSPGARQFLGDQANRVCRFCNQSSPNVTFKRDAHVVPQLLGNKTLMSFYECDDCNDAFGSGIENDLGNWTKPVRTLARIRGQNGTPVLKREGKNGWRIEFQGGVLKISAKDKSPPFSVDETNNRIAFKLPRDPYTPIAVLKAFLRIGITLMPNDEVQNFLELMRWVKNKDHSVRLLKSCTIMRTFHPGPLPNDLLCAILLRRKAAADDCFYMFMILSYANEVYQLPIPCPAHDAHLSGKDLTCPPFPSPGSGDTDVYGSPVAQPVDLMGCTEIRGDIVEFTVHFDRMEPTGNVKQPE